MDPPGIIEVDRDLTSILNEIADVAREGRSARWHLAKLFFDVIQTARWGDKLVPNMATLAVMSGWQVRKYAAAYEYFLSKPAADQELLRLMTPNSVFHKFVQKGTKPEPAASPENPSADSDTASPDPVTSDPYTALYLTAGAPEWLVKAVYKLLMERTSDEGEKGEYEVAYHYITRGSHRR